MKNLLTIADLEGRLGVPRWRLDYAIAQFGPGPALTAGNIRLWRADDIPKIKSALEQISQSRAGRRPFVRVSAEAAQ